MGCPACGDALIVYELDGVEVDCCAGCTGVWLDRGELGAIVQLAGNRDRALETRLAQAATGGKGKGRCPRCRRALEHILLAGDPPLELDRCPRGDGLWFDGGELQAALAHAGGGAASAGPVAQFLRTMFRYHPSKDEGSSRS